MGDIGVDGPNQGAFAWAGAEFAGNHLGIEDGPDVGVCLHLVDGGATELGGAFTIAYLVEKVVEFGPRIAAAEDVRALIDKTAGRGEAEETCGTREKRAPCNARCPRHRRIFRRRSARRSVSAIEFMVGLDAL
jgi:hypothetical protein